MNKRHAGSSSYFIIENTMENLDQDKLRRAKKRVEQLKGFYVHLAVYVVVNAFILVNIYIASVRDGEPFGKWGHFFTLIFWGIGLAFHGIKAFNFNPFFGRDWEERQIQKYIDKDKKEADKYR
jgi:hypothetical protein